MRRLVLFAGLFLATPALAGNLLATLKDAAGLGPKPAANPVSGTPATFATTENGIASDCSYRTPIVKRWTVTANGEQLCLDETEVVVSPDSNYHPQAHIRALRTPSGMSAPFLTENTGVRAVGYCTVQGSSSVNWHIEATFSGCVQNVGFLAADSPQLEVLKGSVSLTDMSNGWKVDPHKMDLSKMKWSPFLTFDFGGGAAAAK